MSGVGLCRERNLVVKSGPSQPRSDGAVRLLLSPISQHKTGGTVPLEVLRFVCAQ